MDDLIIRSLSGQSTPEEEARLAAWRAAAPGNEREYRRTVRLWLLMGAHGQPVAPVAPVAPDMVREDAGVAQPIRWRPRGRRTGAVAVLLAATLAGVVVGVKWLGRDELPVPYADAERLYATGPVEMSTIELEDGTIVRLAPDSRLRVRPGSTDRDVELRGRAFFGVAHRQGTPFRVRGAAGVVVVHGTRFDVAADDESLDVLVIDGRVTVAADTSTAELSGGHRATARVGSGVGVSEADADRLPAWLGRALIFQSTPLYRVAAELSSAYEVPVHVADGEIAERTITAGFADEDLDEVLAVICRVAAVRCSTTSTGVAIEPAS